MEPRSIRWNRVLVVVASLLGVLLACCVGIWALAPRLRRVMVAQFWRTDPQLTAQAAHKFIDYDLPPHYQELKVMDVQNAYAAVIIAHRERPEDMIYMGGVTDGIIGVETWRVRYEENLSREIGDRRYDTRTTGMQLATIRGQPTTLHLLEGTDEAGRRVRQVVCAFKGKSGDMLLAIVASQDSWDQSMVDNFLQSIR